MRPLSRVVGKMIKPMITLISRRRLPRLNGRVCLPDVQDDVTIHRDGWGIPHIRATNRHDLFFAQGYAHAQDRLWQMELNRRASNGELSELFGGIALNVDRLARTLGFRRLATAMWDVIDDRSREDALSYSKGVNAFVRGHDSLPVEFALLHHRPSPWSPVDCLAYARLQMWALTHGAMGELVQAQLTELLGTEKAHQLFLHYPDDHPVTLPHGIELNRLTLDQMIAPAIAPFMGKGTADGSGRGSNAWVIGPGRSATGHAILCNDMHLPVGVPSLWHYQQLRSDDGIHVAGFSLPGCPYVLVGHNEQIAWGATLSYIDCEDLFVERKSEEDPLRFMVGDGWKTADVFEERIEVRWGQAHIEQVIHSRNGPIISSVIPNGDQVIALRSTALRAESSLSGFASLNMASDWEEFVEAVSQIPAPSLNLLYADTSGNIGHYVSGNAPIRAQGDGTLPVPGWTDEYAWTADIPFSEMPHALNPKQGFIISANNRLVDERYPRYLGRTWRSGYRARRLDDLIRRRKDISLEECRRFQLDLSSGAGLKMVDEFQDLKVANPDAQLSLHLLRGWDGTMDRESIGSSVYQMLLSSLAGRILSTQLDDDLRDRLLGRGVDPMIAPVNEFQGSWPATLGRLLSKNDSLWILDRQSILERSLADTSIALRQLLGKDHSQWKWGRLHKIRFAHALSKLPLLDAIFGLGPWPMGGDSTTVVQSSNNPAFPDGEIAVTVSTRLIADLGDLGGTQAMLVPGQSGHLGSVNYDDMILPWLQGDYFSVPWTEADLSERTINLLTLAAKGKPS